MNKIKSPFLLVIILFLIVSCGSRKATTSAAADEDMAVTNVIKNHQNKEPDFETLQGKLRVQFQNEAQNQSVTVNFRMKKDDTIWMSGSLLGIPLAKVMITPESVRYYEKMGRTYFDGDFRLLSNLLGTPLDFEKLQNLLMGQTIYDMSEEHYKLTESSRGYQLKPSAEGMLKKMFLLDAGNYKALAQQIAQEGTSRSVTITYPSYYTMNGQSLPKEIKIIANEAASNTQIDMQFRAMEFNVPVSFPFSIPSGYEEISLE